MQGDITFYFENLKSISGWNPEKLYNGFKKPSARKISTELIGTKKVTPDSDLTHMVIIVAKTIFIKDFC